MRIGASLFLIALGAILKYAVTKHFNDINVQTMGVILMIVGIVGLLIELFLWSNRRRTTVVTRQPGVTYVQPADPYAQPGDPIDRI
jgi:heme/copper-type cytochrome/quinol oxidase subunit 2